MQPVSESSGRVIALSFLNLIGYREGEDSEDIAELFGRAHHVLHSRKLVQPEQKLRWLLKRWVRMLHLDIQDWRHTILMRALFVEEYGWPRLSYILKLSEARVRSLALDALLEEVCPEALLDRPTRDCSRNDLYLLDMVTRQAWIDRMGIYSPSHFEQHLSSCQRCRNVFDTTQRYRLSLLATKNQDLPAQLKWDEILPAELPDLPERPSRYPLVVRLAGTFVVILAIFLGVISAPDLGQYFTILEESDPVVVAELQPSEEKSEAPLELADASLSPVAQEVLLYADGKKEAETRPETLPVIRTPTAPAARSATVAATTKVFFRWGARATDPDRMTEKVLGWLKEMNALNAGELGFGAHYRGGRYFHFTIHRTEYSELLNRVKTLSLTDLTYSAADGDREIPEDRSRIVFWIGPSQR
jgi:hypothetical protein